MATNQEVARIFDQIAAALQLLGANPFRVNSNGRVARVIRDMTDDLADFVAQDPDTARRRLEALSGIGKGSAAKILEYLDTGRLREHQELMEKVPSGLFAVLEIPGIGPKAAKLMWDELGVTGLEELKALLDTDPQAVAGLPRMGAKKVDNISKALDFSARSQDRIPIGKARPIALELLAEIGAVPGVKQVDYAGSLRRGRETIGDLDFLVTCEDGEAVRERFTTLPAVTEVLARGDTKCSLRLETDGVAIQADLRIVPEDAYGAALMYFTGSKEHNVRLREIAIKRGMRLNEYGLFRGTEERPQDSGVRPEASVTEEEIYAALELPYVAPELREDRGELQRPPGGIVGGGLQCPGDLIELADVRAELHSHTVASDGKLTIDELAALAVERGFHTLAVTDHSQSQVIANGLTPQRMREHAAALREADERISGIKILAGAEVDILADGRLDFDDELLTELDVVVASPHAALRQDPKAATERLLAAIRHPLVHIIGHPTGRFVGRRQGLEPDMHALFEAAAEHDTVLELNANWNRLDLRDTHLRGALLAGCNIAINTDAHHRWHLDNLVYGILTARRAGLGPGRCINTWSAEKLHGWLRSKR